MKSKDGKVITKKFNGKPKILFRDYIDYTKKKRALEKHFGKSFRYLVLYVIPELKKPNKKDGLYSIDLQADDIFSKVYGDLKLVYSVENDVAVIEDIEPNQILLDGYFQELSTYKGIPYRNEKDLFKIRLIAGVQNGKKEV